MNNSNTTQPDIIRQQRIGQHLQIPNQIEHQFRPQHFQQQQQLWLQQPNLMTFPINSSNLTMQQNRFPNNYVTNNYNNYVTMMPSFPIPLPQACTQNQLTSLPGLNNHAPVTQTCCSNQTMQRNIFQQNH